MIDDRNLRVNEFLSLALFSRDKNGKVRFWRILPEKEGYCTYTGELCKHKKFKDFKEHSSVVMATSIRTIDAQIAFEMKARTKQRLNSGYKYIQDYVLLDYHKEFDGFRSSTGLIIDDVYDILYDNIPIYKSDNKGFLKPMLAKGFQDNESHRFPMFGQPKINGIRALARWTEVDIGEGVFKTKAEKVVFTSREGKFYNLPHLEKAFNRDMFFTKDGEELVYDGELYIHGKSLNVIRSAVPMVLDNGTVSNASGPTDLIQYWIFDVAALIIQKRRFSILNNKLFDYNISNFDRIPDTYIIKVPSKIIMNNEDARTYAEHCIEQGFEGAIVRNPEALYNFGSRGKDMMKIKKALHTECIVVDIIPKDKEPETALFVLRNDLNEETFECNPMGTYEERKEYLDNAVLYIGKKATIKYYERSGVKKVPFHANVVTIRNYE